MLIFILLSSSTAPSFAHPGSLDSNGGHLNHKTGEYHYHDGNNDDGNSSVGSEYTYDYDYNGTEYTEEKSSAQHKKDKHNYDIGDVFSIAFMVIALIFFIGLFIFTYICPLFAVFFKNKNERK